MNKAEKELAEIKAMMERSTRFLSLSGISGILAGIYALIGAGMAWYYLYGTGTPFGQSVDSSNLINTLIIIAFSIIFLALGTAYYFSKKKNDRKSGQFWSSASKRFMTALFIPVLAGGFFSFALIHEGYFHLIAATTLLFYGMGLISASTFTLNEIKNLGYGQILLGLVAAFHPEIGLICWTLGFGVLHIIYGSMMYYKYDR